jgi:hypothetical protein
MLNNFIRAKLSTHTLLFVVGVMAFAAHRFFSDPRADAWLQAHWVIKDLYETAGATLLAYGIYKSPTPPAA